MSGDGGEWMDGDGGWRWWVAMVVVECTLKASVDARMRCLVRGRMRGTERSYV